MLHMMTEDKGGTINEPRTNPRVHAVKTDFSFGGAHFAIREIRAGNVTPYKLTVSSTSST